MAACRTPPVEPCKVQEGSIRLGSDFGHVVPQVFDRVQVRRQAQKSKTSDVLYVLVLIDDASTLRFALSLSFEHHVLAF